MPSAPEIRMPPEFPPRPIDPSRQQPMKIGFGLVAKWLIPSVAGLFAVVGYIVQAGHSNLLGGGLTSDDGASLTTAAADFFYASPQIALDFLLAITRFSWTNEHHFVLGGHSVLLLAAVVLASSAWWAPTVLRRIRGWRTPPSAAAVAAFSLLILLITKFLLLDAPMARVENVVVAAESEQQAQAGFKLADTNGLWFDSFINSRTRVLWRHMACSRIADDQVDKMATEDCSRLKNRDRSLIQGEFSARAIMCVLVVMLAWKVQGETWPRSVLALLGLLSILSLPYAYGKLLKPTVFEYGKVELAAPLMTALTASKTTPEMPLHAIVLSKKGPSVDLLVIGTGQCGSSGKTYPVTKVWTIPHAQVLSIREIFRRDVITWKLQNETDCGEAPPPGGG